MPLDREDFAEISAVRNHKSWKAFTKALENREEYKKNLLVKELLGYSVSDPEKLIQYTKGYIDGLKFALQIPGIAEKKWTELSEKEGID